MEVQIKLCNLTREEVRDFLAAKRFPAEITQRLYEKHVDGQALADMSGEISADLLPEFSLRLKLNMILANIRNRETLADRTTNSKMQCPFDDITNNPKTPAFKSTAASIENDVPAALATVAAQLMSSTSALASSLQTADKSETQLDASNEKEQQKKRNINVPQTKMRDISVPIFSQEVEAGLAKKKTCKDILDKLVLEMGYFYHSVDYASFRKSWLCQKISNTVLKQYRELELYLLDACGETQKARTNSRKTQTIHNAAVRFLAKRLSDALRSIDKKSSKRQKKNNALAIATVAAAAAIASDTLEAMHDDNTPPMTPADSPPSRFASPSRQLIRRLADETDEEQDEEDNEMETTMTTSNSATALTLATSFDDVATGDRLSSPAASERDHQRSDEEFNEHTGTQSGAAAAAEVVVASGTLLQPGVVVKFEPDVVELASISDIHDELIVNYANRPMYKLVRYLELTGDFRTQVLSANYPLESLWARFPYFQLIDLIMAEFEFILKEKTNKIEQSMQALLTATCMVYNVSPPPFTASDLANVTLSKKQLNQSLKAIASIEKRIASDNSEPLFVDLKDTDVNDAVSHNALQSVQIYYTHSATDELTCFYVVYGDLILYRLQHQAATMSRALTVAFAVHFAFELKYTPQNCQLLGLFHAFMFRSREEKSSLTLRHKSFERVYNMIRKNLI